MEQTLVQQPDFKPAKSGPQGKIDVAKALKLRVTHKLSYQAIADQFGARKQSVYDALKPFLNLIKHPEQIEVYQDNRGVLLNAAEMELLHDLTDEEKRKSASLNNTAYAMKQIHDMRRLEENKSTSNIAVRVGDSERADLERIARQVIQERMGRDEEE